MGLNPPGYSITLDSGGGGVNNHLWSWTRVCSFVFIPFDHFYFLYMDFQLVVRNCTSIYVPVCVSCVKLAVGVRVSDGLCTRGSVYDLT